MQNPYEFPLWVDNTMLTTFAKCPQEFYLRFIRKRVPSAISIHLHFGAVLASALEELRKVYHATGNEQTALKFALLTLWREWGDVAGAPPKSLHDCEIALLGYVEAWPVGQDNIVLAATGEPCVEHRFAVPLPVLHPVTHDPILYCGRSDFLLERDNVHWIVDDKTTGSNSPTSWARSMELRSQFIGYTWERRQHGVPIAGVIARGIFLRKGPNDYMEYPVPFTEQQIEEWRIMSLHLLAQMVDCYQQQIWPKLGYFTDACSSYSGCPYRRCCRTQGELLDTILEVDFAENVWDPLARDPTHTRDQRTESVSGGELEGAFE